MFPRIYTDHPSPVSIFTVWVMDFYDCVHQANDGSCVGDICKSSPPVCLRYYTVVKQSPLVGEQYVLCKRIVTNGIRYYLRDKLHT